MKKLLEQLEETEREILRLVPKEKIYAGQTCKLIYVDFRSRTAWYKPEVGHEFQENLEWLLQ